ncbi:MAG TPA: phosphoribosyltransferase family protein [Segeticoccus sp.]|uniref:phosphoribosyltransferase n=1 Tax=Segeticoccus sp. TaxID=2706531 RepID=UPI002D7E49C1|nr:phosphoribosyltransferase family protein [Segeticoccus sp.]HET8600573.1 phosphoribosyltransferase family protein [Segeticoccus sp.]
MFRDRADAGVQLAEALEKHWAGRATPRPAVALALPRGGVPVAREVARVLGLGLDVLVVKKIGVPWQPELALGAVGERGPAVFNEQVRERAGLSAQRIEELVDSTRNEAATLAADLRGTSSGGEELGGGPALVVDDGIATGATARAAAVLLHAAGASTVTLAAPVCPARVLPELEEDFDEVVVVRAPRRFGSVGEWYVHFGQTSTDEVRRILAER